VSEQGFETLTKLVAGCPEGRQLCLQIVLSRGFFSEERDCLQLTKLSKSWKEVGEHEKMILDLRGNGG